MSSDHSFPIFTRPACHRYDILCPYPPSHTRTFAIFRTDISFICSFRIGLNNKSVYLVTIYNILLLGHSHGIDCIKSWTFFIIAFWS